MNELIALVLPYKNVFYYDALAVAAIIATLIVCTEWSLYFAHRKHWCEHYKIKSIKDDPEVYRLFINLNKPLRKHFYLTISLKFFTDYKMCLIIVCLYLSFTVLTMGYVIAN